MNISVVRRDVELNLRGSEDEVKDKFVVEVNEAFTYAEH